MDEENSLIFFLDNKRPKTQSKLSNEPLEQPFSIVYNARSITQSKSRKASYCKISQLPPKSKKPRKMTLPIESTTSYQFNEEFAFETYSDRNFPVSTQALLQQQIETQEDISSMDLEKGIQCGIVQESQLDKESWFGIKNENPEFEVME